MKIIEQHSIAVAEYRFGCNNIFEDIVSGEQNMHLAEIGLAGNFDFIIEKDQNIQKMLDIHVEKLCKNTNKIDKNFQYKMIHLKELNRVHSAAICYRLVNNKFEAYKIHIWYVIETIEFDKFLESDILKRFPYEEK